MTARSPETRLLLLLARRDLDDAQRRNAQALLDGPLDWPAVLAHCERHGLVPLFERHLSTLDATAVPLNVRAALWARSLAVARRNQRMAGELASLAASLEANGVRVIPYKGPTLALAAYGELGLREFNDLDLLVPAAQTLRAKSLLAPRGYAMPQPLTREQEEALLASSLLYELPLVDAARGFVVELHWREDPDVSVLPLGDDRWWQSLGSTELEGQRMRSLSGSQLLLVLCLHGTKHFWASLGWLVDIAEIMRRDPHIDAEWVRVQARAHGCERRIGLGLRLARDLLDAPTSPPLDTLADDATVAQVASRIEKMLFIDSAPTVGAALRLNLSLRDHARQRISYAWRFAVSPGWGEWLRWRLPPGLFFLYYLMRPYRLARKYWGHR